MEYHLLVLILAAGYYMSLAAALYYIVWILIPKLIIDPIKRYIREYRRKKSNLEFKKRGGRSKP